MVVSFVCAVAVIEQVISNTSNNIFIALRYKIKSPCKNKGIPLKPINMEQGSG
jgi:hypothetical protein